jgi:Zn-dependent peptidase ImmA (M78 family)
MVKIHYTGSEEDAIPYIDLIKDLIQLLPSDIQKRINTHCMIYLIDSTYGYFIGKPKYHVILLNINQIKSDNLTKKEQNIIIAHEFAHYILNHSKSTIEEEIEANQLLNQWGFSKDFK